MIPNLKVVQTDVFQQICATSSDWVPIEEVREAELQTWLKGRRNEGYEIVGLEQTAKSEMLTLASPFRPRTVILLGKEREGIPVKLLRLVDRCVEIPQLGVVRSLNVHVSGAIRCRLPLPRTPQLPLPLPLPMRRPPARSPDHAARPFLS